MNRVELARSVHEVVSRLRGISRLDSGPVDKSTQYAGGRIPGVVVTGDDLDIHVVVDEFPVTAVADRVHAAVGEVLHGVGEHRRVRVFVTDVEVDSAAGLGGR